MNYFKGLLADLNNRKHGPILLMAIISLSVNMFTYFGTRHFTGRLHHYDMTLSIDEATPFIPWTVAIYMGCYVFWIINYILGCLQKEDETIHFWCSDLFAKLVCLGFFIFLPTTNIRPDITGTGIWDQAMAWLYNSDAANNLFPSIHCLTSWFSVIAIRKQKRVHNWYKVLSVLIALAICISTLTTKQHVIVDTFAGVFLAEFAYWFVQKSGFIIFYKKMITAIDSGFKTVTPRSSES